MAESEPIHKDTLLNTDSGLEERSSKLQNMLSGVRTVCSGLWNGIPVELAFVVRPETKKIILERFHREASGLPINKQVNIMLGLLKEHFPTLQDHSLQWLAVRAHFFGCVDLWGKFG